MGLDQTSAQVELDWWNVAESSVFVFIAAGISFVFGTKLEISLIISGIRCVTQLTMMGYVLDDVLAANNPWLVMGLTFVLILLGAYETVFNRTKKTIRGLFPMMLLILTVSNVFISYLGTAFALKETPFWSPPKFIPIVGMLLGNSMSSVAMATEECLDKVSVNAPVLETRLAFGATRFEAARPLAVEAIRVGMLPVITQLGVMGLINIPGMMTGQLMAGMPMKDAVIYQQCIMFMIAASSALGVIMAVVMCLLVLIDKHHALRSDRILDNKSIFRKKTIRKVGSALHRYSCICLAGERRLDHKHKDYEVLEMNEPPSPARQSPRHERV